MKSWFARIFKTSSLIGLSKIIGFIRDLIIASFFGTSIIADAFNFAYLFTGNIFILLGGLNGPFHSATVTALSNIKENKQYSFLIKLLVLFTIIFCIFSCVLYFLAYPIGKILLPNNQKLMLLFIEQLYFMLPLLALTGIIGILFGYISYKKNYVLPSISPVISSIFLILIIVLYYKSWGGVVLAIGSSIGALFQVFIQFWGLFKTFGFQKCTINLLEKDDNLLSFYTILFPALISSSIGSLNVYIDGFFTGALEKGSWTAILMGNRLIQLPFGILVGASLVSFLPRIISLKDNTKLFSKEINLELNNLILLIVPVVALFFALSEPIIIILFQRGEFSYHSTLLVKSVLIGLSGSLLTALPREIYTRAFYALGDSKTPLFISLFSIIINAFFDWFLSIKLGAMGIALSTTITAGINSILSFILLKRKIIQINILSKQIIYIIISGFITLAVMKWFYFILFTNLKYLLIISLILSSLIGMSIYFGLVLIIKKYFWRSL